MREWIEPTPVDVPDGLWQGVGGHRLVAETLMRRGITDLATALAFLNPDLYTPASPYDLPSMERAVERLRQAVDRGEGILIWGDFDVDGQTATTLLVTALRDIGAKVSFYVPHRQREGHGIKVERLKELFNSDLRLLVTCDTGISEHEAIAFAQKHGVDAIVTDHHKLPEFLPDAFACINPQMLAPTHPLYTLPGVGCAYKLIEALYASLAYSERLPKLLDLVALGIVADVALLTGDTRYLLQRGLKVLQETQRPGLKAMLEIAQIPQEKVDEEQIGYAIAPRLNAVGRLGDANEAVEFLSTNDTERAKILAYRFEALNNERRLLVQQVFDSAQKQLETQPQLLDYSVLVLANSQWSAGVLGIVANRLVEEYNRPVVLMVTPENTIAHGSARSVAGCDITLAIASCSQILKGYGGHTMAAGLSLEAGNIPDFRRRVSKAVESQIGKVPLEPRIQIDGYVELKDLSVEFVYQLERLSPFGAGNPPLTLASRGLKLLSQERIGRTKEHSRLSVSDSTEHWQNIIWWQADFDNIPEGVFDLAYTVHESNYKGKTELLVQYIAHRQVEEAPTQFVPQKAELIDYRFVEQPELKLIEMLRASPDVCVWGNRMSIPKSAEPYLNRPYTLFEASTLIVWNSPPDNVTWNTMLEVVKPDCIVLFSITSPLSDVESFLNMLMGLVKYSVRQYQGQVELQRFIHLTGQSEQVIYCGIEWVESKGYIRIVNKTKDEIYLELNGSSDSDLEITAMKKLQILLEEARAFEDYFRRSTVEKLMDIKRV